MLRLENVTKVFKTGTFGSGSTPAVPQRDLRDPPRRGDRAHRRER